MNDGRGIARSRTKLTRRGIRVQGDYEADVLSSTTVADVMTRDVDTLPETTPVGRARQLLERAGHDAFPVVDAAGHGVAILTRRDLLARESDGNEPVLAVATPQVIEVRPDDTLLDAVQRLVEEEVTHLPVVEDDKLIGICTRTDILRARMRQFEREQLQPGWSPSRPHLRRRRHGHDTPTSGATPPGCRTRVGPGRILRKTRYLMPRRRDGPEAWGWAEGNRRRARSRARQHS